MSFNPSKISYREWNFNKVQIESWFNCSAVFQLAIQDPGGNRISQGAPRSRRPRRRGDRVWEVVSPQNAFRCTV